MGHANAAAGAQLPSPSSSAHACPAEHEAPCSPGTLLLAWTGVLQVGKHTVPEESAQIPLTPRPSPKSEATVNSSDRQTQPRRCANKRQHLSAWLQWCSSCEGCAPNAGGARSLGAKCSLCAPARGAASPLHPGKYTGAAEAQAGRAGAQRQPAGEQQRLAAPRYRRKGSLHAEG